jgi:succinate dehydrogenase / fumarate reductase membrane anchor subunit
VARAVTGLRAWFAQRLSAVYMLGFLIFLLAHLSVDPPHSYESWHAWVLGPWTGVAFLLFFAALLLHAWVGVRDVVLDYVHPIAARFAVLALVAIGLLAIGAWVARILAVR